MTRGSFWRDPAVWAVVALALAWRALYLVDLRETPFFAHPQMDALYHDHWARRIAAGDWWGSDVFFRAPLYPYFLGGLYALFGADPFLVRVVQFLIGGTTVLLLMRAAAPRFGRAAALAAGAIVAVYGPLVYFEGELLLVVLETPLFLVAAWSLDRAWNVRAAPRWAAAGLWLGFAALVRPTVLAVPALVVPVLAARRRSAAVRPAAAYLLGVVLSLAPVLAHNYAVGRDIVPVASQGGLNFYLGNNPSADGRAALAENFRATWTGGLEDARVQAESAAGRPLKPSEVSRYWYGRAFAWAKEDPGGFLRLQARKFGYFWDSFEIPNNQDYLFFTGMTRLFRAGAVLDFRVLGPLAVAGLLVGFARRRLGFAWIGVPAVLVAVIVAFFVCDRFRAPLVPFFAIWAAAGSVEALAAVRARRYGPFVLYVAAVAVAAVWMNADPYGLRSRHSFAESYLRLGIHHAVQGRIADAEASYRRAVEAAPGFADGWNNLGTLLAQEGRTAEARDAFSAALRREPGHAKALGNLAALAFAEGNREEAADLARRVASQPAPDPAALYNAAVVLGNLGDVAAALDGFTRVVAAQPWNPEARLGAARAWLRLGRPAEARAVLESLEPARRTDAVRRMLETLPPAEGGRTTP